MSAGTEPDESPGKNEHLSPPGWRSDLARAEKLRQQAELVRRIAAENYEGSTHSALEFELVQLAIPRISGQLKSGQMLELLAAAGRPPTLTAIQRHSITRDPCAREVTLLAITNTLEYFQRVSLPKWDATKGRTLEFWFYTAVEHKMPNAIKSWARQNRDFETDLRDLVALPASEVFHSFDEVASELLEGLDNRELLVVVKTYQGFSQQEIARELGNGATPKTVEGILKRARVKIKKNQDRRRRRPDG